jgi:hypothetical protein
MYRIDALKDLFVPHVPVPGVYRAADRNGSLSSVSFRDLSHVTASFLKFSKKYKPKMLSRLSARALRTAGTIPTQGQALLLNGARSASVSQPFSGVWSRTKVTRPQVRFASSRSGSASAFQVRIYRCWREGANFPFI